MMSEQITDELIDQGLETVKQAIAATLEIEDEDERLQVAARKLPNVAEVRAALYCNYAPGTPEQRIEHSIYWILACRGASTSP